MRFAFLTSTPTNLRDGSGTWSGIRTLADALVALGHSVELVAPRIVPGDYTAQRLAFNAALAARDWRAFDVSVGFDMDGYLLPRTAGPRHVASIKGVIADEMRFESGDTRAGMERQAACEAEHLRRADRVITTSRYSADRLRALYGHAGPVGVVPELLDVGRWPARLDAAPPAPRERRNRILCVCRLYPRKRVARLLEAAALLRDAGPALEVRIVGDGPEDDALTALHAQLRLEGTVTRLGFLPPDALAAEYRACDVFCLPSIQEGFGIVLLEAMAAGRPIVACRAAAVPEAAPHALLVEPDSAPALAAGLAELLADRPRADRMAREGRDAVRAFDAPVVARRFLEAIGPGT
ncbi:MAG: glycosyltransferase family 4 protein [Candidatus Brocadiae bacterium]|nr:glycosyltransferase family 4 protein [Candidatus Brocadiia bacterium]